MRRSLTILLVACSSGGVAPDGGGAGNGGGGVAGGSGGGGGVGVAGGGGGGAAGGVAGGTGATGGSGGVGGGGFMGSGGGCGSALPACASSTQAGIKVYGPDGSLTERTFVAMMTVTDAGTMTRWVLEDSMQQRWAIDVEAPLLPARLINAGEEVQLRMSAQRVFVPVTTTLTQTVALSRAGQLLLFGAQLAGNAIPDFSPEGIGFADDGAYCGGGSFNGCGFQSHRARLTIDGGTTVVASGTAQAAGDFDVSLKFVKVACRGGFCDAWDETNIVGVRVR